MVKRLEDYFDKLHEMYPDVEMQDIKRIVNYGMRMMFRYIRRGCDVKLSNDSGFWILFGCLTNDGMRHYKYYKRKLLSKIEVMSILKKVKWDGYYYVAITDDEYEHLRKNLTITNRPIFKFLDTARVFYDDYKHFVRFKALTDLGYSFYKPKMLCRGVEPIYHRDKPLTLSELTIENNKYDIV